MVLVGLNQKGLAQSSGLPERQVSRLVNGEQALDRETLHILANALKAPPSVFSAAEAFAEYFDSARADVAEWKSRTGTWPWKPEPRADEVAEPTAEQLEWELSDRNRRLAEELGRNVQELLLRFVDRG